MYKLFNYTTEAENYRLNNMNNIYVYTDVCFIGLPNRPGTPEIPQKYNNTALVLWRPSDTMAPCTYSLERRAEGQCSLITDIQSVLFYVLDRCMILIIFT